MTAAACSDDRMMVSSVEREGDCAVSVSVGEESDWFPPHTVSVCILLSLFFFFVPPLCVDER